MAIEHCASAYENGFDAWQFGYDDAMYDGIDMASELPCICLECLNKYHEGQEAAIKEIFAGSQSVQQEAQSILTPSNNRLHLDVGDSPAQQALFTPEADTAEGKLPAPAPRR